MIIPNIWKTQKCSKPPTRQIYHLIVTRGWLGNLQPKYGGLMETSSNSMLDVPAV
jgi:hypothetical protein